MKKKSSLFLVSSLSPTHFRECPLLLVGQLGLATCCCCLEGWGLLQDTGMVPSTLQFTPPRSRVVAQMDSPGSHHPVPYVPPRAGLEMQLDNPSQQHWDCRAPWDWPHNLPSIPGEQRLSPSLCLYLLVTRPISQRSPPSRAGRDHRGVLTRATFGPSRQRDLGKRLEEASSAGH